MNCTRLIQYKSDLYKVRTEAKEERPVPEHIVDFEVDQVIRALVASTQGNLDDKVAFTELQTNHFNVKVTPSLWKAASKLKFKQRNTELHPHRYMYVVTFSLKSSNSEESSNSTGELTEEEIEQRNHAKRKLFSASAEAKNKYERSQGDAIGIKSDNQGCVHRGIAESPQRSKTALMDVTNSHKPVRNVTECGVWINSEGTIKEDHTCISNKNKSPMHLNFQNTGKYPQVSVMPDSSGRHHEVFNTQGKETLQKWKSESCIVGTQVTLPKSRKRKRSSSNISRDRMSCDRSRPALNAAPLAKVMRHRDRHIIEQEQLEEDLKLQQMARSSVGTSSSGCREGNSKKRTPSHRRSIIQIIGDLFMTPVKKMTKQH